MGDRGRVGTAWVGLLLAVAISLSRDASADEYSLSQRPVSVAPSGPGASSFHLLRFTGATHVPTFDVGLGCLRSTASTLMLGRDVGQSVILQRGPSRAALFVLRVSW